MTKMEQSVIEVLSVRRRYNGYDGKTYVVSNNLQRKGLLIKHLLQDLHFG